MILRKAARFTLRVLVMLTLTGLLFLGRPAALQAQDSVRPGSLPPGSAEGHVMAPPKKPAFSGEAGPVPTARGAFLGFETAVRIALANHPLLRKAKETVLAGEASTEQVKARFYPQLDAYAIQTGGTIRPLSRFNIAGAQNKPTSYIESAGFLADQLIYDFGQTAHKVLAEQAGKEAAEKNLLTVKALVILRVQQAYTRCLQQKRFVEIAQETVRERGIIRDQVALLYKRQLKPKLDLDFISVELRSAEVQLLQARNELQAAFAELNNAMAVRGAEEYTLESVVLPPPSGSVESLIQAAVAHRPELRENADRIRQAEANLNAAKALYLPSIKAMGMYGVLHFSDAPTNQYAGAHPGFTQLWWGATATLSVPLFTGYLIENRVAESRAQKHQAEQKRVDMGNQVALEVSDAFWTLRAATQQVKVEEKEVEAATSAFALAKERYRLGLASIVDLTIATTGLLTAEVRLAEAQYALQAGTIALAYAMGDGYRMY